MNLDEVYKNIDSFTKDQIAQSKEFWSEKGKAEDPGEIVGVEAPVDIYKNRQDKVYRNKDKKYPHGASAAATFAVRNLAPALAQAYRKYKCDSEYLISRGDNDRAKMLKNQYVHEEFLPVVEAVIMQSSPDELLNSKEALATLDKYSGATGDGTGFTASYVATAYDGITGNQAGQSDDTVNDVLMRILAMSENGQIRTAYGLAKNIKKKIDNGENMASDEAYAIISRVANFK